MSISFTCPAAPVRLIEDACDFPGCGEARDPTHPDRPVWCGYCDDGIMRERRSDAPDLNYSSHSAPRLLVLLGLPNTPYGEVNRSVIPLVRLTILGLLNSARARQHLVEEPSRRQEPGHCAVLFGGNDDEDTVRRLIEMDGLFAYAEEHDDVVVWS